MHQQTQNRTGVSQITKYNFYELSATETFSKKLGIEQTKL